MTARHVTGIAGLLAGAFSMAVGEYVSVQSQRELLEYQIEFERRQMATSPERERDILVEIYVSRGVHPRSVSIPGRSVRP